MPRPVDWLQIVNQPQPEAEVAALRRCVNRRRPVGNPDRVAQTAKRLNLQWTLRPRGRPKKQE
ncbi:MAG: hypothetical protein NTW96_09105 [Planctomycetia bacterium]|nr:hypothetical protein [Planctomycetia bacterium]